MESNECSKEMPKLSSKSSTSVSHQITNNPWDSKTPEKPVNPPRRSRNRGVALSLKEVREAAQKLLKPEPSPEARPDPINIAAKEQIPLWPESSPSKLKKSNNSSKLPEKYEMLDELFISFHNLIRYLRIKGKETTFTNISTGIENLTDRKFTYSHLAQLKFILPEAIEVKKIRTFDEKTSCMKPELNLDLNVSAFENKWKAESESGNLYLRKAFRERLDEYYKTHPEGDEIPEEVLPEPFNQSKICLEINSTRTSVSPWASQTSAVAAPQQQRSIVASHLPQSFRRRFSQRVSDLKVGNTNQEEIAPVSEPCSAQRNFRNRTCISVDASAGKFSSKPASSVDYSSNETSLANLPLSSPTATPVKAVDARKIPEPSFKGTPAPPASTPARLMSATPGLREKKRCYMSPDDDSTQSPNKLVRRSSRSRSLKFDTPVKGASIADDIDESEDLSVHDDIFTENLIQSIREKERKALLEKDPAISQAKWRQKMISGLPKFFDMIYFLFQSIRRFVITKEELVHKIVSNHLDILDRREVEDRLRLLQELVPEWIYEKPSLSGDLLICVNKISCPELIRTRLAEAK